MLFKVRFSLVRVHRSRGDRIQVRIPGPLSPLVEITPDPVAGAADSARLIIEAVSDVVPPPEVTRELEAIAGGAKAALTLHTMIGGVAEPDSTVDYCTSITGVLAEACRTAFGLLRWRLATDSPHSPFASLGSYFSLDDGSTWHALPSRTYLEVHRSVGASLDAHTSSAVQALVLSRATEPIAHALLREAIGAERGSQRSAVVIAIAAAETGFKQLVSALVPGAEWLVENIQSPPLPKMLKQYLPSLPAHCTIDGSVCLPPKYVRTLLTDGVQARNAAVHTGATTMSGREVSLLLAAVQDLLYLFDFYAGHEWALDLISEEFKAAIGT